MDINEYIKLLIQELKLNQEKNGEFKTYAIDQTNSRFYIGSSPFNTAHIINLITKLNIPSLDETINNALSFLKNLDSNSLRLYKFWYSDVSGTAFKQLPYDLDDTAVVNQAFLLNGIESASTKIFDKNISNNKLYYTWWKPNWYSIKFKPSNFKLLISHYWGHLIFLKKENGHRMAEIKDTDIIVQLNIHSYLSLLSSEHSINKKFPIEIKTVQKEIKRSLHYMNASVYYYSLCRLHSIKSFLSNQEKKQLIKELQKIITIEYNKNGASPNFIAFVLALSFLSIKLVSNYLTVIQTYINQQKWKKENYYVCVGNKNYNNYHQYFSPALSIAKLIRLLYNIKRNDSHK